MNMKLTGFMLVLMVLAIGGIGGFLASEYNRSQSPADHRLIISKATVTADLADRGQVNLSPRCIRSVVQQVKALDMTDISQRIDWMSSKVPLTEWAWELEGHTLAYMKIWGPKTNVFYVEFSRATMNTITFDLMDIHLEFTIPMMDNPPHMGFWYGFVEIR